MQTSTRVVQLLLILFLSFVFQPDRQLIAATPFFWDDFDREDLFDSTVAWYDDATPEEDLAIVDGSLELSPVAYNAPNYPGTSVEIGQNLKNFRLESAFEFVDPANNPFVFMSTWNSEIDGDSDWAGIVAEGGFTVGVTINDNATWEKEPILADEQDVIAHDVFMSSVVVDGEQTLTVWLDGKEQDAKSVTDRRVTSEVDWVHFGINPKRALFQSVLIRHFALLPLVDGDYNASGNLDIGDIDLMADQLRSPDPDRVRVFDVNGDGETNLADHAELVTQVIGTSLGDANLDGEVAFDDFLALSTEFGKDGDWAQGDFDANGKIEFADFLLLSENFGASPVVAPVPEPSGFISCLSMLLGLLALRRMR